MWGWNPFPLPWHVSEREGSARQGVGAGGYAAVLMVMTPAS